MLLGAVPAQTGTINKCCYLTLESGSHCHQLGLLQQPVSMGLLNKLVCTESCSPFAEARTFDHVTSILPQLHWLPIRNRITFNVGKQVNKCLHRMMPPHVPGSSVTGQSQLHSGNADLVWSKNVTVTNTNTTFDASGLMIWNMLPIKLHVPELLSKDL